VPLTTPPLSITGAAKVVSSLRDAMPGLPGATDWWAAGEPVNRLRLLRPVLEHWSGKAWWLAAGPVTRRWG